MNGLTFDTGALLALERRRQRISQVYRTAVEDGRIVTVPSAVVAEWWRGRTDAREAILHGVRVEHLDTATAQLATLENLLLPILDPVGAALAILLGGAEAAASIADPGGAQKFIVVKRFDG